MKENVWRKHLRSRFALIVCRINHKLFSYLLSSLVLNNLLPFFSLRGMVFFSLCRFFFLFLMCFGGWSGKSIVALFRRSQCYELACQEWCNTVRPCTSCIKEICYQTAWFIRAAKRLYNENVHWFQTDHRARVAMLALYSLKLAQVVNESVKLCSTVLS